MSRPLKYSFTTALLAVPVVAVLGFLAGFVRTFVLSDGSVRESVSVGIFACAMAVVGVVIVFGAHAVIRFADRNHLEP